MKNILNSILWYNDKNFKGQLYLFRERNTTGNIFTPIMIIYKKYENLNINSNKNSKKKRTY